MSCAIGLQKWQPATKHQWMPQHFALGLHATVKFHPTYLSSMLSWSLPATMKIQICLDVWIVGFQPERQTSYAGGVMPIYTVVVLQTLLFSFLSTLGIAGAVWASLLAPET